VCLCVFVCGVLLLGVGGGGGSVYMNYILIFFVMWCPSMTHSYVRRDSFMCAI